MKDSHKVRELTSRVVRGAISIALLAIVLFSIDSVDLSAALSEVTMATLIVLFAIDVLLRLLSAYRWHVLFLGLNEAASLEETTRVSLVASFLGQAMPGTLGVEALRIYGLGKLVNDVPAAIASVVADRVFGVLSLVLVVLVGLLVGHADLRQLVLVPVLISLLAVMAIVLFLINPRYRDWLRRRMPEFVFNYIPRAIPQVFRYLDKYKTKSQVLSYSLVLSCVFQVLRVLLFFVGALMMGESPSFVLFLTLVPIVMFVALLPISIAGLGVREASLVALFNQFGVMDAAQAFVLSMLVFVSGILSILPGGWIYISHRQEFGQTWAGDRGNDD